MSTVAALVQQLLAAASYTAKANVPFASAVGNPYAGSAIGRNAAETKLYGGKGVNASNVYQQDWWEYDIALNTWTSKAADTGEAYPGMASAGGFIYLAGGYDGSTSLTRVRRYNPATNTWSGMTAMGTDRYHFQLAKISETKLIAAGGWRTALATGMNSVEVYDTALNTWTAKAVTPSADSAYMYGGGIGDGDSVVYNTGRYGGAGSMQCYRYNLTANAWTPIGASYNGGNFAAHGSGESIDGCVFTVGDGGASALFARYSRVAHGPVDSVAQVARDLGAWMSNASGQIGHGKLNNGIVVAQRKLWMHMRDLTFAVYDPGGYGDNRIRRLAALVAAGNN